MNTSDIISYGQRPITYLSGVYYRKESKEILDAKLRSSVKASPTEVIPSVDSSQYEFPGDRTYERYLSNKAVI